MSLWRDPNRLVGHRRGLSAEQEDNLSGRRTGAWFVCQIVLLFLYRSCRIMIELDHKYRRAPYLDDTREERRVLLWQTNKRF